MGHALFRTLAVSTLTFALTSCSGMGTFKPSQDLVNKTNDLKNIQKSLSAECAGQSRNALTARCEALVTEYERAKDTHRSALSFEKEKEQEWLADKQSNNNMMMALMGGMSAISGMIGGGGAPVSTVSPQAMMMMNNDKWTQPSALKDYEVAEQDVVVENRSYAAGDSYSESASYSGTTQSTRVSGQSTGNPDNCRAGPLCLSVGKQIEPYITKMTNRLNSGGGARAAEAGALAYCVQMVTAEAGNVCGKELEQSGEYYCADLAYQQRDSLIETAAGAKRASQGMSTVMRPDLPDGGFDLICEW
ncbi:hypothetical protein [Azospirillum argentinense]